MTERPDDHAEDAAEAAPTEVGVTWFVKVGLLFLLAVAVGVGLGVGLGVVPLL